MIAPSDKASPQLTPSDHRSKLTPGKPSQYFRLSQIPITCFYCTRHFFPEHLSYIDMWPFVQYSSVQEPCPLGALLYYAAWDFVAFPYYFYINFLVSFMFFFFYVSSLGLGWGRKQEPMVISHLARTGNSLFIFPVIFIIKILVALV